MPMASVSESLLKAQHKHMEAQTKIKLRDDLMFELRLAAIIDAIIKIKNAESPPIFTSDLHDADRLLNERFQ